MNQRASGLKVETGPPISADCNVSNKHISNLINSVFNNFSGAKSDFLESYLKEDQTTAVSSWTISKLLFENE